MIAGRQRGLSATMRRELRRRSAIEATIGHMKTDGRLDRNFLLGQAGDAINALLAAAHNLRLVLTALALWLAFLLAAIAKGHRKCEYCCLLCPSRPINDLAVVQRRLIKTG
jgi:IS5 family transposase